ncbi:uncharacterized protein LOC119616637 [Kryptolebias marmoratus]|uniref:uncharacterized protein LOC119616637 n=1 Tax=Kryptolebias marmoratus TaxID=37003 RepID=UPI0018ACCFE6|nr:uncharacterized protein LOC119616637 [Kryptolebias marmoratus]
MSSGSRMDSLQGLGGQTKDNASREQQHTQPKLQRTVLPPIRPEPRTALPPKSEAALKKHVHRQHTSLRRLRAREQMIFPGWGVQPHSCRELLYVYPPHHSPPKSVQRGFETQQLPSLQPIQGCKQRRTPGQNTQSSATYKHKKQRSVNPPSKSTTTIVEPVQEKPFSLLPLEDFFYPKGYKSDQNELLEIEQRAERQSMCLYGLKLAETPFVVNFRLRKIFFYWHVHALEQHKQRTIGDPVFLLENQLPFACPITGPALREIKGKCYQMCDKEYCRITTGQTITLQEFLDSQLKHTEELLEDLKAFKEQIKEILVSAKEKLEIMEELNNIELRETSPDEPDP